MSPVLSRIFPLAAIGLSLALTPVPAAAKPVVWLCTIPDAKEPFTIPPEYVLSHDEATGQTLVFDGLIKQIKGAPIPASLERKGERMVFSWRVTGLRSTNAIRYSVRFTLTIDPATKAMTVSERVMGYDNATTDMRGKCGIVK